MTDWNVKNFDSFIGRRGYKCDLYRGHLCSCRVEDNRQPEFLCPQCLNRGDSLEFFKEVRVLIQRVGMKTGLESSGIWELGEASMTFRRDVEVFENDAIVYKSFENRKNELIRHTGNNIARLRFNFVTRIERASYLDLEKWNRVKKLDEIIHRGEAKDTHRAERKVKAREMEIVLIEDVDFRLSNVENRSFIVFMGDKKPTEDTVVSLRYFHNPEFVITDLPNDDVDDDVIIVRHIQAKRRDIADADDSGLAPYGNNEVAANA